MTSIRKRNQCSCVTATSGTRWVLYRINFATRNPYYLKVLVCHRCSIRTLYIIHLPLHHQQSLPRSGVHVGVGQGHSTGGTGGVRRAPKNNRLPAHGIVISSNPSHLALNIRQLIFHFVVLAVAWTCNHFKYNLSQPSSGQGRRSCWNEFLDYARRNFARYTSNRGIKSAPILRWGLMTSVGKTLLNFRGGSENAHWILLGFCFLGLWDTKLIYIAGLHSKSSPHRPYYIRLQRLSLHLQILFIYFSSLLR